MSKRKDADAAFVRQEDQRALVVVLGAAETYARSEYGFTNPDILAAVERVKAAFLKVEAPVATTKPEPGLPGQINIDGTVESCPQCGVPEYSWSILPLGGLTIDEPARVQCGMCAHIFPISFTQYNAILADRRTRFGASDKATPHLQRTERHRGAR